MPQLSVNGISEKLSVGERFTIETDEHWCGLYNYQVTEVREGSISMKIVGKRNEPS